MDRNYEIIGNNLRSARWRKGWSQEFVSRQTQLSLRTISRAENGKGLSKDSLTRLCKLYMIPIEEVFVKDRRTIDRTAPVPSVPIETVARLLTKSSFLQDIQREAILQLNAAVQTNAFMCREEIAYDIIPEVLCQKTSYTLTDVVDACMEVNRRTMESIRTIASAQP